MTASDVDVIQEAITSMPLNVRRLTAQEGPISMTVASVGGIQVFAGEIGFPIVTDAGLADDGLVLAFQLEPGDGAWDGHALDLDGTWIYGPHSEHEGIGRRGALGRPPRFATVAIPTSLASASGLGEEVVGRGTKRMVAHRRTAHLRATTLDVLRLSQSAELVPEAAGAACSEMLQAVSDICTVGEETPRGEHDAASWLVGECISVAETMDPMPSPSDLSAALGVSDRWIRAAFQHTYGVSTAKFFRSRALDSAHRELRAAAPEARSVTEVAMRWGFWHLGRFSATYRSYYGELPSETLTRRP